MSLVLEQIKTPGLAQLSYIVGDDTAGVAAVIDPRRDVEVYLERSRQLGLRLTHAIETHIHADFVSGTRELQARLGIPIWAGGSEAYGFDYHPLAPGETLALGSITLTVLHTPGHTPEHVSLLLADAHQGEQPFAIFTGDLLFNLDVGRPDLLGEETARPLARQLYQSLFEQLIPLGDRLEIYPCHGAGSACGKSIGDRTQSTIGNERLFNPALQERSADDFVEWLLQDMPEPPRYYPRLKKINAAGPPLQGCLQTPQALTIEAFQQQMAQANTAIIDTRSMLAFGGGHLPGAINIGLGNAFPAWVGWLIDPSRSILLVTAGPDDLQQASEHLFRLGYDRVAGYLHGGMLTWQNHGLPSQRIPQVPVAELHDQLDRDDLLVLDVRSEREFLGGAVPNAQHIYLPHLEENLSHLDHTKTVATYCGTGYRASIAASLLQKYGFASVVNVPGSWQAWQSASLPVEQPRLVGQGRGR
ncbi:MBL fold metallo-hydrolase [Nodosilinea sp. PGN35]|uniref:MBL fold metallo-hydrolase n=1 Tax=Nodosilinea sp. PGN35 TaxID=3020489 RepID=UPI0023B224FC|nr:MBL fold metallo-hydrolase [Nodosilinea sp. TSF1-S3]MDF0367287.1 MBL fold metallo-hydrolase [Nodosilinea sp. TSF1-S3]